MTDTQYAKVARFFQQMKILHGNDFINSTLRRHAKLKAELISYESKHIVELEREILKEV